MWLALSFCIAFLIFWWYWGLNRGLTLVHRHPTTWATPSASQHLFTHICSVLLPVGFCLLPPSDLSLKGCSTASVCLASWPCLPEAQGLGLLLVTIGVSWWFLCPLSLHPMTRTSVKPETGPVCCHSVWCEAEMSEETNDRSLVLLKKKFRGSCRKSVFFLTE